MLRRLPRYLINRISWPRRCARPGQDIGRGTGKPTIRPLCGVLCHDHVDDRHRKSEYDRDQRGSPIDPHVLQQRLASATASQGLNTFFYRLLCKQRLGPYSRKSQRRRDAVVFVLRCIEALGGILQ
jgi:hypothetical protein